MDIPMMDVTSIPASERLVRTEDVLPKLEDLGLTTDYLKVGDEIFAIKKIGQGVKLEEEIREFYAHKMKVLDEVMHRSVVKDIEQAHQRQLQRITGFRSRGQVAIPREKLNKPVAYTQAAGEVMDIVPIVYHPFMVLGVKSSLGESGFKINEGSFRTFPATEPLQVTIKTDIYIPAFIGKSPLTRRLYPMGGLKTPHTQGGGDLCIGDSRYESYAALDSLEMSKQVSVINMFSPARRDIVFGDPAVTIPLTTLFSELCTVVKVEKQERSQWTVS